MDLPHAEIVSFSSLLRKWRGGMRKLSFSEPFNEEGPEYLRVTHRWYHTKIPLSYTLLILVIVALATTVICLAVRPTALSQTEDAKVVAFLPGSEAPPHPTGLC